MIKKFLLVALFIIIAVPALTNDSVLSAQTMMPLPSQSSTFNGSVRGYYFTAPTDFTITGLRVPTDASTSSQSIEVVRLTAPPPDLPPFYVPVVMRVGWLAAYSAGVRYPNAECGLS
jgi:hypothetical protein